MKKATIVLSSVLITFMLTGCSSTPDKKNIKQGIAQDCVFPNTEVAAPGWICDEPVKGVAVSAVGVAEATKGGISYQKDLATADARGRLAEQMKVQVGKMVKKYIGTTGVMNTETLDAAASSTIKTVTSESLVGSRIYKTRTGPKGRLFVLVGLDPENKARAVQDAVRTSMNNDNALWQQFKSKQSFDEMAKEIANQ